MSEGATSRLELTGITKSFPGVLANDDVSFSVAPGTIHALLGENGAGKSTLVKMIYGIMHPDAGEIRFDGKPVQVANPKAARAMGVGMVFQHFSLFEAMTVLENIALGLDEAVSYADLESRIRAVLDEYNLHLDPHRAVATLSVGERQRIEIVRALLLNPRLLIMDEPTSVLTPQEVAQLFDTLRALAKGGCSILYISHKLHEIVELCDKATILRGGKVVAECDPRQESSRSMAEMMIGGSLKEIEKAEGRSFGAERFVVSDLSLPADDEFGTTLKNVTFSVRAGEIFGVAGVAGNGQNELLLALSGERPVPFGDAVRIDDVPVGTLGAEERRRHGLCAVPEERNGHGAVPGFSLTDNAILTARNRKNMVNWGVINGRLAERYTDEVIHTFAVKTTGAASPAGSLSGGNLQKFIMGREIMQAPEVLVVSQPTWGVDAGAAAAIHQEIVDLAARGSAVVLISQDLDELLAISDTLAVMNEGGLSRSLKVGEASVDEIGLLMGGVHGDPDATKEYAGASHAA
ncbi:ABC transporter ATP-binding protein [Nisaea acidiphila]|uniref:ABC transporter ATP-binding protein n=1 Tax=Nisaea acidiphila TaxID=1862145 RepID=A0A9J7APS2_9PROT|nr:ABC transporter ATP-binding protein [Nisaea acidiphila]UUX49215.1 ABC transporter ATP-binding protein [Nisaea acidiphila]